MNRNLSVYIAVALMLGTAVLVAIGQRATDADNINATARRIADFELPAGYQTDYVIDVGGYTFAAYKSGDEQSHLAFVKVPAGIIPDDDVIEGHVYGGWSQQSQRRAEVLSTESQTVRGEPATLTISERVNGEGQLYRSAYLVFAGHDGPAVLVINQPAAQWDIAAIERFISSIH